MASETVVAVFPSLAHAEAAISDLTAAGVPSASIRHYARDQAAGDTGESQLSAGTQQHRHGFWAWLTGEENNNEHHAMYDRSIESGRTVVTVVTDQGNAEQVHATLERHEPLDLNDQEDAYAGGTARTGLGSAGLDNERMDRREPAAFEPAGREATGEMVSGDRLGSGMTGGADAVEPRADTGLTGTGAGRANFEPRTAPAPATGTARAGDTEQVIPISEETLDIGKREVDRGTTRVRRYVVERPVEEQIRLRDETVSVFRRPASGSAAAGADAFQDREVVVNETSEQAVVGKTARVVEEVVVQKGVQERVETVRDTVRHDEVEVDGPTGNAVTTQSSGQPDPARTDTTKRDPGAAI